MKQKQDFMLDPLLELADYKKILARIRAGGLNASLTGLADSQRAHFISGVLSHASAASPVKGLVITCNDLQARRLHGDFKFFLGAGAVYLPYKETLLYDIDAESHEASFERLAALARVVRGDFSVVVTCAEALVHKLPSPSAFQEEIFDLAPGLQTDMESLAAKLASMGYERCASVEARGQFSVRGGLADIFSVDAELPVRAEFFDIEIDSLRTFDPATQRSLENVPGARIIQAREMLYPKDADAICGVIERDIAFFEKNVRKPAVKLHEDLEKLRLGAFFPGLEKYTNYLNTKPASVIGYFSPDTLVFADEPAKIKSRVENLHFEHNEAAKSMIERFRLLPSSSDMLFDWNDIEAAISAREHIMMSSLSPYAGSAEKYSVNARTISHPAGSPDAVLGELTEWHSAGVRAAVAAGSEDEAENFGEFLRTHNFTSFTLLTAGKEPKLQPGITAVVPGYLQNGFEYPEIGFAIISHVPGDKSLRRRSRRARGRDRTDSDPLRSFTDLTPGDYVVHHSHGIGVYEGISQKTVDGAESAYLKIRYQQDGYLFVPVSHLDLVRKYIGAEGREPKLSKLGGGDWERAKSRVKSSLMGLAEDLAKLYAARAELKGHAFSPDTVWQKEFEEQFPYEETDDQLQCIDDIKRDMESERPMDRLLCGDVGFGKTEVALRAIFKAVTDGKQVAYLVPTTILAQQQYESFLSRLSGFPVTVDVISRFRVKKDQERILEAATAGKLDILIGTHRLLQDDVRFKNLGLLVVDEEQRFGVAHKEKIKNRTQTVDVLSLSATPIPRTLHMSLSGIRDISVIEDPPEGRYPVQTYVMEYDESIVRDAIIRELGRNGQVFYLSNKVRNIDRKTESIAALVPEARVAYAHGQMDEKELDAIMHDFLHRQFDVLVCTTIVESGLDMPNVNTIIIEDADKMGLAQLHQLRGRVGRSNRMAYAYITYHPQKVLTDDSEKRLRAIREFTEFGSGFKIAMRDMEIRGAGNILGPEQHGHMEAVGYDMYVRLLNEAVEEIMQGKKFEERKPDTQVDISLDAYIPESYIPDSRGKMEAYMRIASLETDADAADMTDELIDRYGEPPQAVMNLMDVARIKNLAQKCRITFVSRRGNLVALKYGKRVLHNPAKLGQLIKAFPRRLFYTASPMPYFTYKMIDGEKMTEMLDNVKILLQKIFDLKLSE